MSLVSLWGGRGVSLPAASPCPGTRGRWYPPGAPGQGHSADFGEQGCSEVQAPASGDVAALLLLSAAELAGAPSTSNALTLFISGEAPPTTHAHAPPKQPGCLPDTRNERAWEGVQAAPGSAVPDRRGPALRRHRPPQPQSQRKRLDGRNQSGGGRTSAGGHGHGTHTQRTRRQGGPRGQRAPVARRGAGCQPRRGHGGAPGALPSCPPPSPSDANSLKAAEITGEGRRTSAGAGLLKTVPPHRL